MTHWRKHPNTRAKFKNDEFKNENYMTDQTPINFEKQPLADGEPVFDSPWQAKTFAMAVKLNESGVFSWSEWATTLSEQIAAFEQHSPIANSDDYYKLWQSALEKLVTEKTGAT